MDLDVLATENSDFSIWLRTRQRVGARRGLALVKTGGKLS